MRLILIGNYLPDMQESMQRFSDSLSDGLYAHGVPVEVIRPQPFWGRLRSGAPTVTKWLGYLDKLVRFPARLRRLRTELVRSSADALVHICDHSNALYVRELSGLKILVTCHDVLAVRSALGEVPENPTGRLGRRLQARIVSGLASALHVACVSESTRSDLLRVLGSNPAKSTVVPNGLNYPYRPMPAEEALSRVSAVLARSGNRPPEDRERPFILHVGGNQWYKNREGVLHMYRRLVDRLPAAPDLLMAGKPLTEQQAEWISDRGLGNRVISCPGIDNESLRALYSRASLLLFPSLAEGFGWPILEAQACGCPVVTAGRAPMSEIGGSAALYCNPRNFVEGAELMASVLSSSVAWRKQTRENGLENAGRFSTTQMIQSYRNLYQQLLAK